MMRVTCSLSWPKYGESGRWPLGECGSCDCEVRVGEGEADGLMLPLPRRRRLVGRSDVGRLVVDASTALAAAAPPAAVDAMADEDWSEGGGEAGGQ